MSQKLSELTLACLQAGIDKIEKILLKSSFSIIRNTVDGTHRIIVGLIGKQNFRHDQWFMHATDQFLPDSERTRIQQDRQSYKSNRPFGNSCSTFRKERKTQKGSLYYFPNTYRQDPIESKCSSQKQPQWTSFTNGTIPLWAANATTYLEYDDEEEVIRRMRERKTKRDQFKTKFLEAQKSRIIRKEQKSQQGKIGIKKIVGKADIYQNVPHFIDMEVTVKDQEQQKYPLNYQKTHRKYLSADQKNHIKNQKKLNISLSLARQKQQPLKPEERLFILQVPKQMKLSHGVSNREHSQRLNNSDIASLNYPTKKKLQFLKNSQLNPCKIKLSQLLSYKKLGTQTNLAYCSSMKTVKDIGKQSIQSKISIDSKQFIDQIGGNSRKLIKIANRKVFEELMSEGIDQNLGDPIFRKSRNRIKKQGKVRFDNTMVN